MIDDFGLIPNPEVGGSLRPAVSIYVFVGRLAAVAAPAFFGRVGGSRIKFLKPITPAFVQMHFPAQITFVADGIQDPWQRGILVRRKPASVAPSAYAAAILAREKTQPGRNAQRRVRIGVLEHHPAGREPIEIRCRNDRVAVAAHYSRVVLVRYNHKNIRTPVGCRLGRANQRRSAQHSRHQPQLADKLSPPYRAVIGSGLMGAWLVWFGVHGFSLLSSLCSPFLSIGCIQMISENPHVDSPGSNDSQQNSSHVNTLFIEA